MNAIAKQTSAPAVPAATGGVNGLVPQSMDQAIRLADMMSRGRLVPKHLQDSPGDCLMVIEQAMRWNMSPFAVAQATSVIQGKMMFEGKVVAAAVQASSAITGWIDYEFGGENGGRYIVVKATRRGETEQKTVKVTLAEAKTTNQWWQKTPDQMLVYHGTRVWGRRWVPSVMLGVYSPEEMQQDGFAGQTLEGEAEPEPARLSRAPAEIPSLEAPPPVDKLAAATDRLVGQINACQDEDALHAIAGRKDISDWRARMRQSRPELEQRIAAAYGDRYAELTSGAAAGDDDGLSVDEPAPQGELVP